MKIGILTFHRADNYGALLQAYALQETLKALKQDVEIVDYRCEAIENDYVYNAIPSVQKNIFRWSKNLIKNLYVVSKLNSKKIRCAEYRANYLQLGKSVQSVSDRETVGKRYDLIITGSDQIWNSKLTLGKDDWYCFKNESEKGVSVVSYGASVGSLEVFREIFDLYKKDLLRYSKISVRETDVQAFLQTNLSVPIKKVLDPTLLMGQEAWNELVPSAKMRINRPYVLYYDVEHNPIAQSIARKVSEEFGLKLVHFDPSLIRKKGRYVQNAGPCEFLWLIKNAQFVITSSFHATVFSVIFEKKFIVVPHPQTGARVRSLICDLNLNSRICNEVGAYSKEKINAVVDYDMAFERLKELQKDSFEYLVQCIDDADNM